MGSSSAIGTPLRFVLLGGLAGLASACEVQRPANTYETAPFQARDNGVDQSDLAVDPDAAVEQSMPGSVFGGTGGTTGSNGGVTSGTGGTPNDAGVVVEADPRAKFAGDYYVRIETVDKSPVDTLGDVTTTSTSYGIMHVGLLEGQLVAEERICFMSTRHQTSVPLTSMTTEFKPGLPRGMNPVVRTFSINGNAWSTTGGIRRQGWVGESPEDMGMPTQASDPALSDTDGDGTKGVHIKVTGVATAVRSVCDIDMVSYSKTAYVGGTLGTDGLFRSADIDVQACDAHALVADGGSGCNVGRVNDDPCPAPDSDRATFAPVPGGLSDYTVCPSSQSVFTAAF